VASVLYINAYFVLELAEGVGFEPTLATRTRTVFKTVSINRSDTPPQRKEMIAQGVPVMTVGEGGRPWSVVP
jgi:hypothetical protein